MTGAADWRIDVDGGAVSARYDPAIESSGALYVMAHGAGGNLNDRAMAKAAEALRGAGLDVLRFNFLYKEKGGGRPDVVKCQPEMAAVVEHARRELAPRKVILGGRSFGGRVASMLAADGFDCDGVLLLAYPLHPPGQPEKLRDAHLSSIRVPVLCFNGTRDEFCTPALMDRTVQPLENWRMHWLDGADHSFHVLKSSGRNDAAVLDDVASTTAAWLRA